MTEQVGFLLLYYGTFAGGGAIVGLVVAALIHVLGR